MDKTPDLSIADAVQRADAEEVELFLKAHPDFYANRANAERLMQRAIEICGNAHPFFMDYEAAYHELLAEGGLDQRPAPESEPDPEVQNVDEHGITRVPTNTGAKLTVDPEVRRELNKLSLPELARRAAVDRHANLSDQRKRQIKASEI